MTEKKRERNEPQTGVLFLRDATKKRKEDDPDLVGRLYDKDGVKYQVSGWFKESRRDGHEFITIAFREWKDDETQQRGELI